MLTLAHPKIDGLPFKIFNQFLLFEYSSANNIGEMKKRGTCVSNGVRAQMF